MNLGFNPNTDSSGTVQGSGYIAPVTIPVGDQKEDPNASTLSHSLAEALTVQFLASWPILEQPGLRVISSAADALQQVNAGFAKIGSEMWDGYLKHLAEEKRRIEDYLKSPGFQYWLEQFTLQGLVGQSLRNDVAGQGQWNATESNEVMNGRIQNAIKLWTNAIDGVSNYINQEHDTNAKGALFIVASFAITATFIGNYMNVVDVASTEMVTVKPIQDSIGSVLPLVQSPLQDAYALAINLFAVGLVHFSNAEAILKTGDQKQRPPTNWESVATFAKNVLEKVEGNMINAYLMAMLINQMDQIAPSQVQKQEVVNRLAILAKALMLATAAAALLKAATPDLQLTGQIFMATLTQPLKALSSEDAVLVQQLQPVVIAFNNLRKEVGMSDDFWNNLVSSLAHFFDGNPAIEDLVNPATVYGQLVNHLFRRDIEV